MTILLHYTVSYFSENRPVPGSDSHPFFKYTSTRRVFELFLPIHMKTVKRWKYDSIPYSVWVMQQSKTEKNRTATPPPPPPPKSRMKPCKSQNAPFYGRWWRGVGGGGSKISICFVQDCSSTMMYDFTGFEKLRFRPSTRKQKDGDFKNLQLLTISDFKNTRIRVSGRGLRVICHPSDMLCISVQPIWRHICV